MRPNVRPGPLLLALALAGCGTSPSTRYYTLAAVTAEAPPPQARAELRVRIDAVTIPAELDRLELVRHDDPNRLEILGLDRWGAPLDEQIRHVLYDDLAERLPGHVLGPAAPQPGAGTPKVAVDVDRFDVDAQGRVVLTVDWSVVSGTEVKLRSSETVALDAAGTEPAQTVAGMSRALGRLADRIAAVLAGAR